MKDFVIKGKSKDEAFMRQVYLVAERSKDPKTKIGAVLVKDGNLFSSGFNGFPRKVKDLNSRYQDRDLKHKMVCHAEHNSILSAARNGISCLNSVLYTQGVPCNECCKAIIQAGVIEIIIHKQWPNLIHNEKWVEATRITEIMCKESGVKISSLNKILNIEGILDGKPVRV